MEEFTRDALRMMRNGDTRTFLCRDAEGVNSAASSTYQFQYVADCEFTCKKDFESCTVTVTRLPKGARTTKGK